MARLGEGFSSWEKPHLQIRSRTRAILSSCSRVLETYPDPTALCGISAHPASRPTLEEWKWKYEYTFQNLNIVLVQGWGRQSCGFVYISHPQKVQHFLFFLFFFHQCLITLYEMFHTKQHWGLEHVICHRRRDHFLAKFTQWLRSWPLYMDR